MWAGKGKEEKVLYGRNSVGLIVKMLREEYEIETDPKMFQQIMNPAKVRTLHLHTHAHAGYTLSRSHTPKAMAFWDSTRCTQTHRTCRSAFVTSLRP